jgi:hypothetical protein
MHHLPTENFQETIRAFPTEILQQSQEDYFRAFRSSLHLARDF